MVGKPRRPFLKPRALDGKQAQAQHLRELGRCQHQPSARTTEAYDFASVIPQQIEADEDALGRASTALEEARRTVTQSDGFDTSEMEARLEQATEALASGNASQATGLADGGCDCRT